MTINTVAVAIFGSRDRGVNLLNTINSMPECEVVLVATDNPQRGVGNPKDKTGEEIRIWRYYNTESDAGEQFYDGENDVRNALIGINSKNNRQIPIYDGFINYSKLNPETGKIKNNNQHPFFTKINQTRPLVAFAGNYGPIIPPHIIKMFPLGIYNFHTSALNPELPDEEGNIHWPKFKGARGIQNAYMAYIKSDIPPEEWTAHLVMHHIDPALDEGRMLTSSKDMLCSANKVFFPTIDPVTGNSFSLSELRKMLVEDPERLDRMAIMHMQNHMGPVAASMAKYYLEKEVFPEINNNKKSFLVNSPQINPLRDNVIGELNNVLLQIEEGGDSSVTFSPYRILNLLIDIEAISVRPSRNLLKSMANFSSIESLPKDKRYLFEGKERAAFTITVNYNPYSSNPDNQNIITKFTQELGNTLAIDVIEKQRKRLANGNLDEDNFPYIVHPWRGGSNQIVVSVLLEEKDILGFFKKITTISEINNQHKFSSGVGSVDTLTERGGYTARIQKNQKVGNIEDEVVVCAINSGFEEVERSIIADKELLILELIGDKIKKEAGISNPQDITREKLTKLWVAKDIVPFLDAKQANAEVFQLLGEQYGGVADLGKERIKDYYKTAAKLTFVRVAKDFFLQDGKIDQEEASFIRHMVLQDNKIGSDEVSLIGFLQKQPGGSLLDNFEKQPDDLGGYTKDYANRKLATIPTLIAKALDAPIPGRHVRALPDNDQISR